MLDEIHPLSCCTFNPAPLALAAPKSSPTHLILCLFSMSSAPISSFANTTEAMVASYWPYLRQMYTGGEACVVEGKTVERQVELRAACSPDSTTHLLVR
jgi:hypothetical protein